MKTVIDSYRLLGLVCALGTLHFVGACAADDNGTPGDGGHDGATSTGGKSGTGGRPSSGGSAGTSGAGGASGAATGCTTAVPTECDGAEDCPAGKKCCGEYNMAAGYDKFGCYDTCGAAEAGAPNPMGALLFEMCHAGETCEDSTAMCLTSPYLPTSLSRCLPAGVMSMGNPPNASLGSDAKAINCGDAVCGDGEQCCIRQPLAPYCAPKGTTCSCDYKAPDGGAPGGAEAGVPEAGVPDARVPDAAPSTRDASTDAHSTPD